MLRTALALAARGMAVFPCRERAKQPATEHGLKDATTDPEIIKQWWQQEPQFNLAIATGAASGIFVVDIDGLDAEAELRRLETEHGELPATVEVVTPRPGRHLYFRMPGAPLRNSASKIAPGIDVRAAGGFVVCPPSIHPSGRPMPGPSTAPAHSQPRHSGCSIEFASAATATARSTAVRMARIDSKRRSRRAPRLHPHQNRRLPIAPPRRPAGRARAGANAQHGALRTAIAGRRRRPDRQ